MTNKNEQQGVVMARTRQQILAELREIQKSEGCTLMEAGLILVVETVENDPRALVAERWIRAENSGRKQASAVFDSLMKEAEKGQKK
jgi:hypothetical protein